MNIEKFKEIIQQHEDQLFGIQLFFEGIKLSYSHDEQILEMNAQALRNIVERGKMAIDAAKALLNDVENNIEDSSVLDRFQFPPIQGIGLDPLTERASSLVQAYNKLFPGRPRDKVLNEEELKSLREEAIKSF